MTSPERNPLILIPARGGSKGIPRKNLIDLAGKPLIAYTIEAALEANIGRVVVSTDDPEIAEVAKDFGAEVPFLRPDALATDTATMVDVVSHALSELVSDSGNTGIGLLQPTSPLRGSEDITGAFKLFVQYGGAVVSVTEATKPLSWYYRVDDAGLLHSIGEERATRRQDVGNYVLPNGAIYFIEANLFEKWEDFFGPRTRAWEMSTRKSVDIDEPIDWLLAESIINGRLDEVQEFLSARSTC